MKLIICGNGLDIHVGLDTSYTAYKDYLENEKIFEGKNAIRLIENSCFFIPRDVDCWSDLENALSFDCEKYIGQYIEAFDRDTDINKYETCISQIKEGRKFFKQSPGDIASDFTNTWFWEWIARQYYKHINEICKIKKDDILHDIIGQDSVCINFNYTHTLEDFLGLKQEQILYIHNRLPDERKLLFEGVDFEQDIFNLSNKKFQFGSVRNSFEEWERLVDAVKLKSSGKLMNKEELKRDIKEIYLAFSKDLSVNYDILKEFIESYMSVISEIIVLGHSVLGVDEPYYKDIITPMLSHKKWSMYWHDKDSEEKVKEFSNKYGLQDVRFVKW